MSVRVKTEGRRQAIVEVALEVFREMGYERASMAMISQRLGGSKGTLYGYFRSKEDLFETAMKAAIEGPGDQIMSLLDAQDQALDETLTRFAQAYVTFITGPDVLAITRTAIAEGYCSALGPHLFEQGPGRALAKLTEFFAHLIEKRQLVANSAAVAATHFKGLIEAGFLEEALYGAGTPGDGALADAVQTFLRAYQ